jgi:hypothetical protein
MLMIAEHFDAHRPILPASPSITSRIVRVLADTPQRAADVTILPPVDSSMMPFVLTSLQGCY